MTGAVTLAAAIAGAIDSVASVLGVVGWANIGNGIVVQ